MADPFLLSHLEGMDDFWGRRGAGADHEAAYEAYGIPVTVVANDAPVLDAAAISAGRYSRSVSTGSTSLRLTVVVDHRLPPEPLPVDWPVRLRYQALGAWLMLASAPWARAALNLGSGQGAAWISPALAEAPYYLSRYVFDTLTLNTLIHTGVGQLHASSLYRDGRAILLSAPHNTGKSTTAFHLVRRSYDLLSDGMTYVRPREAGVELLGYPVGEVKLRPDVLDAFPELEGRGRSLLVREDTKMIYDLRRALPERVLETGVFPRQVVLCLLERGGGAKTVATPLAADAALEGLWQDAAHYDDVDVLEGNLSALRVLLRDARCYRLRIGRDPEGIARAVDGL